jgi:hypothetical protein
MDAIAWQSDRGTPSLAFHEVRGGEVSANAGFASLGQVIYAANGRQSSIARIERSGDDWRVTGRFPIETRQRWLTSIALFSGDSLLAAVDLANGIHLLARDDGRQITSITPQAPCRLLLPQIRGSGHTLLLSGECRLPEVRDTIFGVLLVSPDSGRHFTLRHRHPRFAVDGAWGSMLGPRNLLSVGAGEISFGDGYSDCTAVFDAQGDSLLRSPCMPSAPRYAYPAPAEWKQRMVSMQRALEMRYPRASEWPDPLPLYVDRLASGKREVWVRLVTADSVELQSLPADGSGQRASALLVAPMNGFRGCDAHGCLWLRTQGTRTEASFLTGADLERGVVATRGEARH